MPVNIKIDMKSLGVAQKVMRKQSKQVTFALIGTINEVLFEGQKKMRQDIPKYIDRPVGFTRRSGVVLQARKGSKRPRGRVGFQDDGRSRYMGYQIEGGVEPPRGRAHAVPTPKARLNAYGNVTPGTRAGNLLAKPGHFSGVPKNMPGAKPGVWRRTSKGRGRNKVKGLEQVHIYSRSNTYRKRYPFYKNTRKHMEQRIASTFQRRFLRALATAR